jgi:hypothetical protein
MDMRRWLILGVVVLLGTASLGAAVDADVAACVTACDRTRASCEAAAAADVEKCKKDAYAPCEEWCPCTQFIGAAHFACLLECERCEDDAEVVAARCPDGSEARATCAAAHRRCTRECE